MSKLTKIFGKLKDIVDILRNKETPELPTTYFAELHPDTDKLVKDFSVALAGKLLTAQYKYGYTNGWKENDWMDQLRHDLLRHIEKGDPVDVAAYCAFLWYHNEPTNKRK